MNKQGKLINGIVEGGIEWVKIKNNGTEIPGFTWNPVGGCKHACRWTMPDGSVAKCYAESVAEGVAQASYPNGFEHHYWRPDRLEEPLRVKDPRRIFWDSMADLFGAWVPTDQIEQVLDVARRAHWHTFQSLTKNAPRMLKFDLPANVWPGASMPPDFMLGQQLSLQQQERMLHKTFRVLKDLTRRGLTTWMSFEPLSWDVSDIVRLYPDALRWAVIGAASNGAKKYQPESGHVQRLLDVLDDFGVPVFFKGNLEWSPWREEFPANEPQPEVAR